MPELKSANVKKNSPKITPDENILYLYQKIERLERREKLTRRKNLTIETELQNILAERDHFKRKYLQAKQQLDELNHNPLPIAVVENILTPITDPRAIVRLSSGQNFLCKIPSALCIEPGDTVALHQRSMTILEKLPSIIDHQVHEFIIEDADFINFSDIGGLDKQLLKVRELIEISLVQPELFSKYHIRIPAGILMYGPPGTGKTLIAKAVAHSTKAKFINIAAPELVKKYIGEGARMIRDIFKLARTIDQPVIIFIDEIDAIAAKRTSEDRTGEREVNRTLMQLLAELDGFGHNDQIRLLAATNRIDILDPAILRPGRFDRIIELPLPDSNAREAIFQIYLRDLPTTNVNLEKIVQITEGFSGADIQAICSEAAIHALRSEIQGPGPKEITFTHFLDAIADLKEGRLFSGGHLSSEYNEKLYA